MRILAAVTLGLLSTQAWAYDFSEADNLFKQRAAARDKVVKAKELYNKALTEVSGDEAVYAVAKLTRLAVHEGKTFAANDNERKAIYEACLTSADKIAPATLGSDHPAYFYAKAACLSLWAQANGILSSLRRSKELFGYLDSGIAADPTYEGGGFYRIKGAAYQKLPVINPFGPTKDLNKSQELLEAAIDSPAYNGGPQTEAGEYYFDNFFYYAETLHALGETEEALRVIEDSLDRINSNDISQDRAPETATAKKDLVELKESLQ